jgi:porin
MKGIIVFSRVSASPSDRNFVSAYADGGIVFAGMIPGRPADIFGASAMYTRFSDNQRAFDRDRVMFGVPGSIRDYEANLELTYQAQIIPGWTVQPTAQYIWHPSVTRDATVRNATVFGVRSIWKY